ncbi:ras GTPase-activating protein-binding protein 2 isoform X1 [Bicyclus anynana]|uniref:Ras GTPase-activating protein-binding protein 2 isoform X1 n=1 Tax=Bicyclus anynana TaxID=110368 RepID=A0ABM3LLI9_BICAN|nr:ras GTPase-activating protein-binding protein 2 isoform X1 [Bicyclus anynana]XP_052739937.1 ras GTPase-activating protein-binding protein 2 isoform X1 [Bicyclus anynana]
MVMEASPSPQSVGREFVRQYYTLLNKAPAHLHRFYNNYSSFVHGGLDAPNRETLPVIGQKQIHNRIQQLNFRDCHAKISQVDAQATLGNGVVVQVTGELSNGGAPMRRFTQTFVLAAQSPKKYYVHNDIFRYQDIVFSDEEGSGSGRSEGEEEEGAAAGGYFPPAPNFPAPFPAPPAPPHAPLLSPPAPAQPAAPPSPSPPAPHLNGHPPQHDDATRHLVSAMQVSTISSGASVGANTSVGSVELEEVALEPEPEPEPEREPSPPPQPTTPVAPEPKTYANLLKSGSRALCRAPARAPRAAPASAAQPAAATTDRRGRGQRAAVLGRAAAVPGQPAALRHRGRAAGAVRALRARRRAARAQQAGRARRAAPPQLRLHHVRERAGRRRLPQRGPAVLPRGGRRGRGGEAQRGGEEDARAGAAAPPPAVLAPRRLPTAPALPPLAPDPTRAVPGAASRRRAGAPPVVLPAGPHLH